MKYLLSILFLVCLIGNVHPVIIGSTSTVSSQGLITFPNTDTNNTIVGYAFMGNGFSLQDNTTSCTFSSFMQMSGPLNLNGGRLILNEDLICTNTFTCQSGGRFYGNSHAIEFPKNVQDFSIPGVASNTAPLNWVQITSINMFAAVQSVDWSFDNKYIAAGSSNISSNQELKVYYFDGATLTTTQSIEMGNLTTFTVRWHPTLHYLAVGRDNGTGVELRIYQLDVSNGTFTLVDSRNFTNLVVSVNWHPSGNYLLAATSASGAPQVFSYSFDTGTGLLTNGPTLQLNTGSLLVQRDAVSFAPGGDRFAVGINGQTGGISELYVCSFSAASLAVTTSYYQNGTTFASCEWHPTGTYIACGLSAGTQSMRLFKHTRTPSESLTVLSSAFVGETALTPDTGWGLNGTYLSDAVSNGASSDVNIYYFDKITETLTLVATAPSATGVNTTKWSHNSLYVAYGNAGNQVVVLGITPGGNLPLYFDTTTLTLNADLTLNTTAYFINNCRIDGRGQRLTIGPSSRMIIRPNTQLILDNIEVQGLKSNYLECMVDSGALTLRNCILSLDDDFTFSRGTMFFDENVMITGTSKFIYSSRFGSTIGSQSVLILDSNVTLSYSPTVARKNLLTMVDQSSMLFLNGCSLVSTRTGLILDTGTLIFDNNVTLSSGAKNSGEAIELRSNLTVKVLGGAKIDLFGYIKTF